MRIVPVSYCGGKSVLQDANPDTQVNAGTAVILAIATIVAMCKIRSRMWAFSQARIAL